MKIKFIVIYAACAFALFPKLSFGTQVGCFGTTSCPSGEMCMEYVLDDPNCLVSQVKYYNIYGIASCTTCKTGYTRTENTTKVVGCTNTITFYTCELPCTGCTNCTSDTTWSTADNIGYEKKVTRTCDCNTCNESTEYRCAAGYYGSSLNGTSGCTKCPTEGNLAYGTMALGNSAAGSTAKTSCYIQANTPIADSVGTYTFTSNCFYTN